MNWALILIIAVVVYMYVSKREGFDDTVKYPVAERVAKIIQDNVAKEKAFSDYIMDLMVIDNLYDALEKADVYYDLVTLQKQGRLSIEEIANRM